MNDFAPAALTSQPNVYGPITPSQMFERTFQLLRENFKLFFGIVAVLIGVEFVFGGILGGTGFVLRHSIGSVAPIVRFLVVMPAVLVGVVLLFIFIQIIQGALFIATEAKLAHASITVGGACKLAAEKAGTLIGIAILVALRTIGYLLLFYAVFGVVALIAAMMFGGFAHLAGGFSLRLSHMPSLGVGIFVVFFVLVSLGCYLFTLLWLMARYALSIPATLAENLSVTDSIRRSIHLSSGSRGRLYALILGVVAVYLVSAAVTVPVQLMVSHGYNAHLGGTATGLGLLGLLLALFRILVSGFVIALMGVATALCYFDLRVRKEGFGMVTPPPTVAVPMAPAEPLPPTDPAEDFPIA